MTTFVGIDPGVTTGIVTFWVPPSSGVVQRGVPRTIHRGSIGIAQCNLELARPLLNELMHGDFRHEDPLHVAVEHYVAGRRSVRTSDPEAQRVTRDLLAFVRGRFDTDDACPARVLVQRPAATVKPWATDVRLEAAGLLAPTAGQRHARDAARHALYEAVHSGALPDPLSKAARS